MNEAVKWWSDGVMEWWEMKIIFALLCVSARGNNIGH